jgi:ketosteroid isomerase-like protein
MGVAENIAAVRRFYAAGPPQDDAKRHAFAAPDIVWHVPGENPVAGRYEGHAAVFGEIGQRMQPLDDWTIEVRAVMGNADLVVAMVDLVAARGPHRVACTAAHAFRFDAEGRIAEVWGFVDDQAELDALFGYTT